MNIRFLAKIIVFKIWHDFIFVITGDDQGLITLICKLLPQETIKQSPTHVENYTNKWSH